jgi:hypothetical protein
MKHVLLILLLLTPLVSNATTWGGQDVDDPIVKGEKCSVHVIGSYGSYIYRWPSKYDQVFWPFTDKHGIWHCKTSGFTAFINDFEGLTDKEVIKIKAFLDASYKQEASLEGKLILLEQIYALRDTTQKFDNQLLRILARWYQNLEMIDKANIYRKKAYNDIKDKLGGELDEVLRLEYLYLAVNYSTQFGETENTEKYSAQLNEALEDLKNEKSKGYAKYLSELVKESQFITVGGRLDPVLSK